MGVDRGYIAGFVYRGLYMDAAIAGNDHEYHIRGCDDLCGGGHDLVRLKASGWRISSVFQKRMDRRPALRHDSHGHLRHGQRCHHSKYVRPPVTADFEVVQAEYGPTSVAGFAMSRPRREGRQPRRPLSFRMSVVGTKRTNPVGLMMSVVRSRPEVAGWYPKRRD